MSTASVRPGNPTPPGNDPRGLSSANANAAEERDQGDRLIGEHLEAVRAALWRSVFYKNVLLLVATLCSGFLTFVVIDQWFYNFGPFLRTVWWIGLSGLTAWWTITRLVPLVRMRVSPEYAAYSVEHDEPDLKHSLTSYVTLRNDRDAPGLRGIVVRSIGARAAKHLSTSGMSMPTEALGNFRTGLFTACAFAALVLYAVFSPKDTVQTITRLAAPLASVAPPSRVSILEVNPGDTESLFGRSIEVTARISGLGRSEVPRLSVTTFADRPLEFRPTDQPNLYASEIPASLVQENFEYQVLAGDAESKRFDVSVRNEPTVNVAEVKYQPHAYTGLPPRTATSGSIDGLEGTRVTVVGRSNRKIARGRIEFNPRRINGQTSATAGFAALDISEDGRTVSATWNLRTGRRSGGQVEIDSYRLRVWDDKDTTNPDPIEYPIRVSSDLAPEVRITVPNAWPKDVPLGAEQLVEVRAADPDFGLSKVEIRVRRRTRLLKTVPILDESAGLRGPRVLEFKFRPDDFGLMSGDLIAIEAVAYDNRTNLDGTKPDPNVVVSDPIELNIVDRPAANEVIEDGDGLSQPEPEEKPTEESKSEQPQQERQESERSEDGQQSADSQGDSGDEGSSQQAQDGEGGGSGQDQQGSEQSETQSGGGASDQPNAEQGKGQGGSESGGGGGQDGKQDQQQNEQQSGNSQSASQDSGSQRPSASDDGADSDAKPNSDPANQDRQSGESTREGQGTGKGQPSDAASTQPASDSADPRSRQGSRSPASNDGEAMERMRDYFNEKRSSEAEQTEGEQSQQSEQKSKNAERPSGEGTQDPDVNNGTQRPDTEADQRNAENVSNKSEQADQQNGVGQGAGEKAGRDQRENPKPSNNRSINESQSQNESEKSVSEQKRDGQEPTTSDGAAGDESQTGYTDGKADRSDAKQPEGGASQGDEASPRQNQSPQKDSSSKAGGQNKAGRPGDASEQPEASNLDAAEGDAADPSQKLNGGEGKAGESNGKTQSSDGDTAESTSSDTDRSDSPQATEAQNPTDTRGAAEKAPADAPPSDGQASGQESSQSGSQSNAEPPQDPDKTTPSQSADGSAIGNNSSGQPMPEGGPSEPASATREPDPVDLEAAKKATDLVLDSLKNQRDNPDQELLDRLGWTDDQLRRFVDRWEKTRKLGEQGDAAAEQQYKEALKSLGIRPPTSTSPRRSNGRNDSLQQLQDTGSRKIAPPQFRDAIEAYRRSLKDG